MYQFISAFGASNKPLSSAVPRNSSTPVFFPKHSLSRTSSYSSSSRYTYPSSPLHPSNADQSFGFSSIGSFGNRSVASNLSSYSFLSSHRDSICNTTPDIVDLIADPTHTQEEGHIRHIDSKKPPGLMRSTSLNLRGSSLDKSTTISTTIPKTSLLASLFLKQRKLIYASVNQSELLDRFKKIVIIATDLAVLFRKLV